MNSPLSWPNHLPRPYLQIPSHWRLGFNVWILVGTQSVYSSSKLTPCFFEPYHITTYYILTGKNWRQEEKGMIEDEMVGWHHWLDGHEFEQALGVGDGQKILVCCSPWGCKELNMTEQLNWAEHLNLKELPNQRPHKFNKNGLFWQKEEAPQHQSNTRRNWGFMSLECWGSVPVSTGPGADDHWDLFQSCWYKPLIISLSRLPALSPTYLLSNCPRSALITIKT